LLSSTGRVKSEKEKEKIGKASKGNNYGCGYKHTDEAKHRIGIASLKRWNKIKEIRNG